MALLLENGLEYVAGFFGILKAGACCVALNSANKTRTTASLVAELPAERQRPWPVWLWL